ncbi:MAG: endonuclease/exonuclease/phosphatase family protein [Thermoplasmata archaeon]|nr:MAG: endonuclease/exonuclease/phosphatase family protein [Thermoplasmata archaeon]
MRVRICTYNLENLDDKPDQSPTLAERIAIMRPQLLRLRADILCFQEVHGQEHMGRKRDISALIDLLRETPYANFDFIAHTKTTKREAYDERNLVVLSRFPITYTEQIKHEYAQKPKYRKVTASPREEDSKDISWERPIFYVKIDLGGYRTLHLMTLHLKSKIPTNISGQKESTYVWRSVQGWAEGYFISSMKRVGQALEVRILTDRIFDEAEADGEDALVAICGDFNADSDSVPVNAIRGPVEETGNPELSPRIMVPCENNIPDSSRYSLLHLGRGEMLDHILVSRPLLGYFQGAEIHNEVLPDESGAFRTDVKFPESDHAPVVAQFEIP